MVHFNNDYSISSLHSSKAHKHQHGPSGDAAHANKGDANAPAAKPNVNTQDTVTISLSTSSAGTTKTSGVDAYNAVADVTEGLNPFAKTIVSFIDAQLRRDIADGATPEELQSRLEAGLEGFLEGFGDAYAQLEAMGQLTPDVKYEVDQTQFQVLSAINGLAEELGLEKPVQELPPEPVKLVVEDVVEQTPTPIAPAPSGLEQTLQNPLSIEQQNQVSIIQSISQTLKYDTYEHLGKGSRSNNDSYKHSVAKSQSFDLTVRTRDGDTVKLTVNAKDVSLLKLNASGEGAMAKHQSNALAFEVVGELDEGELKAINALLSETQKLSETFFNGDLDAAFKQALKLQMDGTELAAFALNLQKVELQTVEQTQRPNPELAAAVKETGLQQYASKLLEQAKVAEHHGVRAEQLLKFLEVLERNAGKAGLNDFAKGVFKHQ